MKNYDYVHPDGVADVASQVGEGHLPGAPPEASPSRVAVSISAEILNSYYFKTVKH